eukprot:g3932.t1
MGDEDEARAGKLLCDLPAATWTRWSPVEYTCGDYTTDPDCLGPESKVQSPRLAKCFKCGVTSPVSATDAEVDAFVAEHVVSDGGLAKLKTTASDMESLGITPLAVFWQAPIDYLDAELSASWGFPVLNTYRIPDVANFIAASAARLVAGGVPVPYVELLNEVDGYWWGVSHVNYQYYPYLVDQTAQALARRGLSHVKIVGPATSSVQSNLLLGTFSQYLTALKADAPAWAATKALSVHTYDWVLNQSQPFTYVDETLGTFMAAAETADPDHTRLRIASEFSNENYIVGNKTWKHAPFTGSCYPDSAADDMYADAQAYDPQYIVRNVALLLLHINAGFDAAIFWELADKRSDNKCFGLYDRVNRPKPILQALSPILKFWPAKGEAVRRTWVDDDVVMAVVTNGTRTLVSVANTKGEPAVYEASLSGVAAGAKVANISTYVGGVSGTAAAAAGVASGDKATVTMTPDGGSDWKARISLPANSVATVILAPPDEAAAISAAVAAAASSTTTHNARCESLPSAKAAGTEGGDRNDFTWLFIVGGACAATLLAATVVRLVGCCRNNRRRQEQQGAYVRFAGEEEPASAANTYV